MPRQPDYPPSAAVYGKGAYKGGGGGASAGMDWSSGMAQVLAAGLQVFFDVKQHRLIPRKWA